MTPVFQREITHPSAWTPASIGSKEGLVHTLGSIQLAAIDEVLEKIKNISTTKIRRHDFDHASLAPFLKMLSDEVMNGRCAAIVRGVSLERYSRSDCERIFWGIGTHLGRAQVQSSRADRIGYVQEEPGQKRGYRGSGELVLHTDSTPILALMSLQNAAEGGESFVASSMTVHNLIRRERQDLLDPLYRGYPYRSTELELTPCSIPIFSNIDGLVSCMFFEGHMRKAARELGVELPKDLDEALCYFAKTGARDDVSIRFMLDPGEMSFYNNFAVLHARSEFKNSADMKRVLARLWLSPHEGRRVVPELLERSQTFSRNYDPEYDGAE
jgi:hypothetical protein